VRVYKKLEKEFFKKFKKELERELRTLWATRECGSSSFGTPKTSSLGRYRR
jgi:hypothetical protein